MTDDIIHVRGLTRVARHGVYEEERQEGRSFTVDVDAFLQTRFAGLSDELSETVDYRDITSAVLSVLEGPSRLLIERLAEEIAAALLERIPRLQRVRVTLWKRATGVPGDPERVGITVERDRAPR